MHVPDSHVKLQGKSKGNIDQIKAAFELLSEFNKHTSHNPANIVILPYKANVEYRNGILRRYPSLAGMPQLQTADSFQGQEGTTVVVVFGTNKHVGLGFTSNKNRLNVMVTRQKRAFLLVGDKAVTGALAGKDAKITDKAATNF
ncbi:hypothetical protein QBC37DRAFT_462964 [Rhypophila decipiens]|uniref:DNA2/NAM7 helicase-like C-terminal domain-containing protein n=1 Tax=Rhypophila decipiens TaxID=261697 RepID=A0AAN7B7M3_9PEZI|nr:hypothetical protein QBC37DRAFT_462964 [Rhypophila decipiens]